MANRLVTMHEIAEMWNKGFKDGCAECGIDPDSQEGREALCDALNHLAASIGAPVQFHTGNENEQERS